MKAATYIRVSTKEQNFDGQVDRIHKYLEGHGITPVASYEDKATGKNTDRKGFKSLQEAIFNGEVDTVIVYKLDRISRSLRDGINILTDWLEKDIRLICVEQQLDFNGQLGKMLGGILFAVAEMDYNNRRENQSAGIEKAKQRNAYAKHGRKKGVNLHNHSKIVELFKAGHSKVDISKFVRCSRMTVHRVLTSMS